MNIIKTVALLLIGLTALNAEAQEPVKVKSFSMTTDHIPGDYRQKDLNGDLCALLKVQVLDDIEGVDGNKIGDIVDRGVEKWIYLCKGSRNVRLRLKNHLPVRVVFKDYKVNALESNRVYELVLELPTQAPVSMAGVKGNDLRLKLVPGNAILVLWGDNLPKHIEYPQADGTLKVHLPYGRYNYFAEADGYIRTEGNLFVDDKNEVTEVRLAPIVGELVVNCPTKADIFVNGVKMESSKKGKQWTGKYPVGQYVVEARAKRYAPKMRLADIRPDATTTVDFGELTSEKELKKKGLPLTDESATLKESALLAQAQAEADRQAALRDYQAKVDSMRRANTYDVINMADGSTILCTVTDVDARNVMFKQKGVTRSLQTPVRLVESIQYGNGEYKEFKGKKR